MRLKGEDGSNKNDKDSSIASRRRFIFGLHADQYLNDISKYRQRLVRIKTSSSAASDFATTSI